MSGDIEVTNYYPSSVIGQYDMIMEKILNVEMINLIGIWTEDKIRNLRELLTANSMKTQIIESIKDIKKDVDVWMVTNLEKTSYIYDNIKLYGKYNKLPKILILTVEKVDWPVETYELYENFEAVEIYTDKKEYDEDSLNIAIMNIVASEKYERMWIFGLDAKFNVNLQKVLENYTNIDFITESAPINWPLDKPNIVIDLGYSYDYQITPYGSVKPYYRKISQREKEVRALMAENGICYRFEPNFCFTYDQKIPNSPSLRILNLLGQQELTLEELADILTDMNSQGLERVLNSLQILDLIDRGPKNKIKNQGQWIKDLNEKLNFQLGVRLALSLKYWHDLKYDLYPLIVTFAFLECYQDGYFHYKLDYTTEFQIFKKKYLGRSDIETFLKIWQDYQESNLTLENWTLKSSIRTKNFTAVVEYIEILQKSMIDLGYKCQLKKFDVSEFITALTSTFYRTFFDNIYTLEDKYTRRYSHFSNSNNYYYGSNQNITTLYQFPPLSIISCLEAIFYNIKDIFYQIQIALPIDTEIPAELS